MSQLHIEQKHKFGKEEARARLDALAEYLQHKHGIRVSWSGDVASFAGKVVVVEVEGTIRLDEGGVLIVGKDPGFLWRKKATEYLTHKLAKYLDPATPVDKLARA